MTHQQRSWPPFFHLCNLAVAFVHMLVLRLNAELGSVQLDTAAGLYLHGTPGFHKRSGHLLKLHLCSCDTDTPRGRVWATDDEKLGGTTKHQYMLLPNATIMLWAVDNASNLQAVNLSAFSHDTSGASCLSPKLGLTTMFHQLLSVLPCCPPCALVFVRLWACAVQQHTAQ